MLHQLRFLHTFYFILFLIPFTLHQEISTFLCSSCVEINIAHSQKQNKQKNSIGPYYRLSYEDTSHSCFCPKDICLIWARIASVRMGEYFFTIIQDQVIKPGKGDLGSSEAIYNHWDNHWEREESRTTPFSLDFWMATFWERTSILQYNVFLG